MITTEDEYKEKLKRIDKILEKPESDLNELEDKELDDLVDEVEAYEKIHYPMQGD